MGEWLGERFDEESDVSEQLALRFVCCHRVADLDRKLAAPQREREVCVSWLEVDAADEMAAANVFTRGHGAFEHVCVPRRSTRRRVAAEPSSVHF